MHRSEAWAPNTIQPHATKAVIMRIHSHTNFKPDLILAFRALMVEAQEYGYHVFFLTTVCFLCMPAICLQRRLCMLSK